MFGFTIWGPRFVLFAARFIIAPPACIKDLLDACFHRDTVAHVLAKRKEGVAPPPTVSPTPLASEGLDGAHFLTLAPYYSPGPRLR